MGDFEATACGRTAKMMCVRLSPVITLAADCLKTLDPPPFSYT